LCHVHSLAYGLSQYILEVNWFLGRAMPKSRRPCSLGQHIGPEHGLRSADWTIRSCYRTACWSQWQ